MITVKQKMTEKEVKAAFEAGKLDNNGGKAVRAWFGQNGMLYVVRYYRDIYKELMSEVIVDNEFVTKA